MKKIFAFLLIVFLVELGCSHIPDKGINNTWFAPELKESRANGSSHNAGRDCMSCHSRGGNREAASEGVWTVGGTVYQTNTTRVLPGSTLELYTGPNETGVKVISLPVDKKGNAYSNKKINFGSGLYPVVIGPTGKKEMMISSINQGACNSCHNNGTPKITVDN